MKAVSIKIGTNAYIYTDKIAVLMILIFIHHLLLDQISCLHMHLQYSKSVETRVKDFFLVTLTKLPAYGLFSRLEGGNIDKHSHYKILLHK